MNIAEYSFKYAVIGETSVGKKSLRNRFQSGSFDSREKIGFLAASEKIIQLRQKKISIYSSNESSLDRLKEAYGGVIV